MTRIAAYVPDLIDRSKVAAAAHGVTFVERPEELSSLEADLVVLDLSRPGAVDVIPRLTARTLGFGRHTQRELLEACREWARPPAGLRTVRTRAPNSRSYTIRGLISRATGRLGARHEM